MDRLLKRRSGLETGKSVGAEQSQGMPIGDPVSGEPESEFSEQDEAENDKHSARDLVDQPQPLLGQLVPDAGDKPGEASPPGEASGHDRCHGGYGLHPGAYAAEHRRGAAEEGKHAQDRGWICDGKEESLRYDIQMRYEPPNPVAKRWPQEQWDRGGKLPEPCDVRGRGCNDSSAAPKRH